MLAFIILGILLEIPIGRTANGTCRYAPPVFTCPLSGECFPLSYVCDNSQDCSDNSDEADCGPKKLCPQEFFNCGNGHCIKKSLVCDNHIDCANGEDESHNCPPPVCLSDQKACKQFRYNSTYCYPEHWHCDKVDDCFDQSDEEDCVYRDCLVSDFTCYSSNLCLPAEKKCDGHYDCRDNSDEDDCNKTSCFRDQFRCLRKVRCIPMILHCNGRNDCDDGTDEENCNQTCLANQFRCENSICLPLNKRCNGFIDCLDESDEANCTIVKPSFICQPNEFPCPFDGSCIDILKVCDGSKDCSQGEDEESCSDATCSALSCDYKCQKSPTGGTCYCHKGFQISDTDGRTCVDMDECSWWGHCDQICTNTFASYECSCANNYNLLLNGYCQAVNSSSMRLLFSKMEAIFSVDKAGTDIHQIVKTELGDDLDYHYAQDLIFWSDKTERAIYVKNLSTPTDGKHIIGVSLGFRTPLAVDWISNKLYFGDAGLQLIIVSELNGSKQAAVVSKNLSLIKSIAIDAVETYLFFLDGFKIERTLLDGDQRAVIVNVFQSMCISLDLVNKRLYWTDTFINYIESVDYNGQKRVPILKASDKPYFGFSLTMFEDMLYWTDWRRHMIFGMHKYKGEKSIVPVYSPPNPRQFLPMGLKAYHPSRQPSVPNPCGNNNGGCQDMCVAIRKPEGGGLGYRCICNIGNSLAADGKSCRKIKNFLLYSSKSFVKGVDLENPHGLFSEAMKPVLGLSNSSTFVGLDFDARDNYIYISDVIADTIYRVQKSQYDISQAQMAENRGIEGLALDWISKILYFIDSVSSTLNIMNVKKPREKRTLLTNLKRPRGLVLHPNKGFMFYSEWQRPAQITKAFLDGKNQVVIRNTGLGWPNGMTIDYQNDRLYWCDALLDHIQHSDFNGNDVKLLASEFIVHPFSLVVYGDFVYYSDWTQHSIIKAHKLSGGGQEVVVTLSNDNRPYTVHVYSLDLQHINENHPCLHNGNCSSYCFAVPSETGLISYCGCPNAMELAPDNHSCIASSSPTPINQCTNSDLFYCDDGRCITHLWVCDGEDDCIDRTDELNCSRTCLPTEHKCSNGICISQSYVCDGDDDCRNMDDELNCPNKTCFQNEFSCANGRCIIESWTCDSMDDCGDRSDEGDFCRNRTCSFDQFSCGNGECIPLRWKCNGRVECVDKSDEKNCPEIECAANFFSCDSHRRCLQMIDRCDGFTDCDDGSDEENCDTSPLYCQSSSLYLCPKSKECISKDWLCDGHKNCADGTDETESCGNISCPANNFQCKNKYCISNAWLCDGKDDCGDNSDEDSAQGCGPPPIKCLHYQWKCAGSNNSICINISQVCDGHKDCPLGSDEGGFCDMQDCKHDSFGCSYRCFQTPLGASCSCPPGSTLIDNKVCGDINECDPPGMCSQTCDDLVGSYHCRCVEGYTLTADRRTCKAIDDVHDILVISSRQLIIMLEEYGISSRFGKVNNPLALAFNYHEDAIYWFDLQDRKILKGYLNGTITSVISSSVNRVEGLVIDWVAENIYWVDSGLNTIEVATLDGAKRIILFSENISSPRGIALDPSVGQRLLFWTDWGKNPRIERSGLDGSHRQIIVSSKLLWPNAITLDLPTKRVYFADSKLDFIDFCNYDGSGRQHVLSNRNLLLHPHAMAIFEDSIYWTDRQLNQVSRFGKFFGKNSSEKVYSIMQPLGIAVYHPALQPLAENPCASKPCSYMCLLSPTDSHYTCFCSFGSELDETNQKCTQADVEYLLVISPGSITGYSIEPEKKTLKGQFPIIGIKTSYEFDYDKDNNMIYWIEQNGKDATIMHSLMNGENKTSLVANGIIGTPNCLTFDWIGRNLYICNNKTSTIELIKVDGEAHYRRVILSNNGKTTGVSRPVSIALDPLEGMMYWLDEGGGGVIRKVGKARLDGSSSQVLYSGNFYTPECITIDVINKKLYWSERDKGVIKSGRTDGTNFQIILEVGLHQPIGLDVLGNKLFVADKGYETISHVDLSNTDNRFTLKSNIQDVGRIRIYHNRSSISHHPCLDSKKVCGQICIPMGKTNYTCQCTTGFVLTYSTKLSVECREYQQFAIVSQVDTIRGINIDKNFEAMVPISRVGLNALSTDFLYSEKSFFWADNQLVFSGNLSGIHRQHTDGTGYQTIVSTGIGSNGITGLAIDWIAKNLYFINVFSSETYIEVCRLNGSFRLVLIKSMQDAPRSIAVNPIKRYLYWTDSGQYPRIVRSLLDGTNETVLISSGISMPRDITIDMSTHDVYWVDSLVDSLQKMAWSGGNRQIVRSNLASPSGVAIFDTSVIWVDRNLKSLFKASKEPGKLTPPEIIRGNLENVRDVIAFKGSNQPPANSSCSGPSYGGCEQLCFAMPGQNQRKCACAIGLLDKDEVHCKESTEFLIYSTMTDIHSLHLDKDLREVPFEPFVNLNHVTSLDFDYPNKTIFYTKNGMDSGIFWFNFLNTTKKGRILGRPSSLRIGFTYISLLEAKSLTYDWVEEKLYWIDDLKERIYSVEVKGNSSTALVPVVNPIALVLDPCRRQMYFSSSSDSGSKIERTTLTGHQRTTIIDKSLVMPSGLAIDYEENRLYWIDYDLGKIERSFLNGSERQLILKISTLPFSIAVFRNYIYWTDLSMKGIFRAEKDTGADITPMIEHMPQAPIDLKVFSFEQRKCDINPCSNFNGGCSHTCKPLGMDAVECECPPGYSLYNQNKMCIALKENLCNLDHDFICQNNKCIMKIWTCDGVNDCGDSSDENENYCAVRTCSPDEFLCSNTKCINADQRCDHENDCGDDSDEQSCVYEPCDPYEFTCQNKRCISVDSVCNGVDDCRDGISSDENSTHCLKSFTCELPQLKCPSTKVCIDPEMLCDEDDDCGDNSDENPLFCHNKSTCPPGFFKCANQRCIPEVFYCDGRYDCDDHSDEPEFCNSTIHTCSENYFTCDNGKCVPKEAVCNEAKDCEDGSDEGVTAGCHNITCHPRDFECHTKMPGAIPECIASMFVCDGDPDCYDGSDEYNCTSATPCPNSDDFRCQNQLCIKKKWVCDRHDDCGDGSDERTTCAYNECNTTFQFECANKFCIKLEYKCDGMSDCNDGSDEIPEICSNTTASPCSASEYLCRNGHCISNQLVCNHFDDCLDGSDESSHCNVNECLSVQSNQCEQQCIDLPIGFKCSCKNGYKLVSNGHGCQDINECDGHNSCSQICENTIGSYFCKCNETYYIRSNKGYSCLRKDAIEPWIIFSSAFFIRNISLDGQYLQYLLMNLSNVVALDFDKDEEKVYFTDISSHRIMRMNIFNSNPETLIDKSTDGLEGIAVDWVGRKLYWTDRYYKQIFVSNLNGTHRKVLLPQGLLEPRSISVHPGIRYFFVTDWSMMPCIARIGMDGSNLTHIVNDKLVWPNALTIDFFSNKLFWGDARLNVIEYSDFDGKNRHTNLLIPGQHIFSLTVFDDYIYWSEWNKKIIYRADKFTGEKVTILRNTTHRPFDVRVYHPLRHPHYANPCSNFNGGCSHLCLLSPNANGYTCACPDGFILQHDAKTCIANCTINQFRCGLPDEQCIAKIYKCDGSFDCADKSDEPLDCPPRYCKPGQFQCNSKKCLNPVVLCDGEPDCEDSADEEDCDKPCDPWQFKCRDSGRCISLAWVCDYHNDCIDGSDENVTLCPARPCNNKTQFLCKNGRCVPKDWFCDSDDDCGDKSDEPPEICHNRTCPHDWFQCSSSYRCVPNGLLCDGGNDCYDGSDELASNCVVCNPLDDFVCRNQRCIPINRRCDFENDCGDNSDEDPALCAPLYRQCSESEFRCKSGRCVSKEYVCNKDDDCGDGSDEVGCAISQCPESYFRCANGHCVEKILVCDGARDCPDYSDEWNCSQISKLCKPYEFHCQNSICISQDWQCDGLDDCGDGSDESIQTCANTPCKSKTRYRCGNGRCIPTWRLCDDIDNCGDLSDENEKICAVLNRPCLSGQFKCTNERCVDVKQVCDRVNDCLDGSDEFSCHDNRGSHKSCSDQNGGCEQKCHDLEAGGYLCSCKSGFKIDLLDRKSCQDINECEFWGNNCPQLCINLKGNHTCSCKDGYVDLSHGRGKDCRALGDPLLVLFGKGGEIREMDTFVESYAYYSFIHSQGRVAGIDYDPTNDILYWADSGLKTIKRAFIPTSSNPDESLAQDLEIPNLVNPQSVAVDWGGKNLYWTDPSYFGRAKREANSSATVEGGIFVSTLEGRYTHPLIFQDVYKPWAIAVNPNLGLMFWTEVGFIPSVKSSWMDGTHITILAKDIVTFPTGITIDYAMNNKIYWCDAKENLIESMNSDGSNRARVVFKELKQPFNLDVFENFLYYTTKDTGEIYKVDKFGMDKEIIVASDLHEASGIKLFQSHRYNASVASRCSPTSCSHICLLTPATFTCLCSDGYRLKESQRECQGYFELPRPLPDKCMCLNDGSCRVVNDKLFCVCKDGFNGSQCEIGIKDALTETSTANVVAIVVPIILCIIILAFIALVFFYFKRKPRWGHFDSHYNENPRRVSFHNDNNINFGTPDFMGNGLSDVHCGDPLDSEFNIGDPSKPTNFSNPVYDVIGQMEVEAADLATMGPFGNKIYINEDMLDEDIKIVKPASPKSKKGKAGFSPASVDTGKDTQVLVEEDYDEKVSEA